MNSVLERAGTVGGVTAPKLSYLICATPRSGSTLLSEALRNTGIAGCPEEHFEVLLETGQPRQPRDYFQRSNDPEVWALLDDPEFRDVLGEYGGRYAEHPARQKGSDLPVYLLVSGWYRESGIRFGGLGK